NVVNQENQRNPRRPGTGARFYWFCWFYWRAGAGASRSRAPRDPRASTASRRPAGRGPPPGGWPGRGRGGPRAPPGSAQGYPGYWLREFWDERRSRIATPPQEDFALPRDRRIARVTLIRSFLVLDGDAEPERLEVFRVHPKEHGVVLTGVGEGRQEPH